jgi:hypothetical protein
VESSARAAPGIRLDLDNPWPGVEAYGESSHAYFSGRALEADELRRRILDEPTTVLFGKSGLGKTSLLVAGVFPHLRERDLLPIFLRLQFLRGTEPLIDQVRRALFDELRAHKVEHPAPADGETLWDYLHRSGLEFRTTQSRLVQPVFVFDQFEEVFTLGPSVSADVAAFRQDLADLAENRFPAILADRLGAGSAREAGLDVYAMPYKMVIVFREDFLADLEGWHLIMPSLRRNRMRLLPLGPDQARQAVYNARTSHIVSEALARNIVAFLSTRAASAAEAAGQESAVTVDPAYLSMFCRAVNEHRKRAGKARFDEALVEGGKATVVTDFYRTSLEDQPERVKRFIAEALITERGYRNSYPVDDAFAHEFLTAHELQTLIDRRLLRKEHHLGAERIELTHDRLTNAAVEDRDKRRDAERKHQRRRRLVRIAVGCIAVAAILGWVVWGAVNGFGW